MLFKQLHAELERDGEIRREELTIARGAMPPRMPAPAGDG